MSMVGHPLSYCVGHDERELEQASRLSASVVTERSQEDHVWVTCTPAAGPIMIVGTVGRKRVRSQTLELAEQGAPNRRTE
jgi:hypothetical protein